jgi:predicted adenylyl cyclase CyaB
MWLVATPRRNIELKAIDPDPAGSLQVCRALSAQDEGVLWQRDSYFNVSTGGLKLREQKPGRAHLIQFERAEEPQQRESRYRIVETDDPQTLLAALTAALGVTVAVTKHRRLFLWQNVRIHLDDVEGLGTFIELEAVAPADSDLGHEYALVKQLREAFSITDDRLRASGYAQQLIAREVIELVERVRAIPYGRPSNRTVESMLREQRGTCSAKHLYLAQQLAQGFPATEPAIIHRVYRLDRDRARALFGEEVAQTIPLNGLIDIHRYLTIKLEGQRLAVDATFPGGAPWDGRSPMSLACGPGEDIPAGAHPDSDKQALERRHCDPAIREPFIAALAQISQPRRPADEQNHQAPRRCREA